MLLLILFLAARNTRFILGRNWSASDDFATLIDVEGVRLGAMIEGGVLALALLASLFRRRRVELSGLVDWAPYLYAGLALVGLLEGYRNDNPAIYILGDAYQYGALAVGYYATLRLARSPAEIRMAVRAMLAIAGLFTVWEVSSAVLSGDIVRARFGTFHFLTVLMFMLPRLVEGSRLRFPELALYGLAAINLALSVARSTMMVVGAVTLVYVLNCLLRRGRLPVGVAAMLVGSAAAVGYYGEKMSYRKAAFDAFFVRHFSTLFGTGRYASGSVTHRLSEAEDVMQEVLPARWVLGGGMGAVVFTRRRAVEGDRHYVHMILPSVLLRAGLLGVGVHLLLVVGSSWRGIRRMGVLRPGWLRQTYAGALTFFVVVAVNSMIDSNMFLGWSGFLGLLLGLQNNIYRLETRQVACESAPVAPAVGIRLGRAAAPAAS